MAPFGSYDLQGSLGVQIHDLRDAGMLLNAGKG
jgi:hypothetical protein